MDWDHNESKRNSSRAYPALIASLPELLTVFRLYLVDAKIIKNIERQKSNWIILLFCHFLSFFACKGKADFGI